MTKPYQAVLFDLDGTLLDTLDDLTDSVNHALSVLGCAPRTREQIRSMIGNGAEKLIERALPAGADEAAQKQALSLFRAHYGAHCCDRTVPYEGIPALLTQLKKAGFLLAIVSNKPDSAVQTLRSLFFDPWIRVAIGGKEGVPKKPAPDAVHAALRELTGQAAPSRALYVGDSDVDIATARAAGMDCVSVAWGFRDEAFLRAHGASAILHTPKELAALLSVRPL